MAGPLADTSGAASSCSTSPTRRPCQDVIAGDPYTREHATADHRIRAWNVVVPAQG